MKKSEKEKTCDNCIHHSDYLWLIREGGLTYSGQRPPCLDCSRAILQTKTDNCEIINEGEEVKNEFPR